MPDAEPLEAALDELYDVDPADFMATRTRLAAALRSVDAGAARAVKVARRPTTAAWAMNRVSRDQPDLVAAFLDRSRELHEAQVGAVEGGRDAVRDATRAQREALARATDAALEVLGDRGNDAYRTQVMATLHAASIDGEVAEQLQQGRLTKEVSGPSGFPEVPGLSVVPPLPTDAPPQRAPRSKEPALAVQPAVEPGAAAAAAAAEEAARLERAAREERSRRELADAEEAAERAQVAAVDAEEAARNAHVRARRLEDELEQSRRAAREADTTAARTRREASQLARAATKLRSRTRPS